MKWKLDEFEQKNKIKANLFFPDHIPDLEQDIKNLLFRSVTELLNNIVKHASATTVELRIIENHKELQIRLSDNGKGFDVNSMNIDHFRVYQYGLFSIRERISYYGGKMEINSQAGKGTIVTLSAPFKVEGSWHKPENYEPNIT